MLKPTRDFEIPTETSQVAQASFPKGNTIMKIRDEMGTIFRDEDFAELYPDLGQPAIPPWRLALITVMQYMENLTDRQAAEAVRGRIDWKYALGLRLDDPGFDFSVLSEFRERLLEGGQEGLLLERILDGCETKGLLKGKHLQRTDATHVIAAIRCMNRLEMVGETMRRALNELAQVAPEWLKRELQPEWVERYGKRFDSYRLPKSKSKREALAIAIGQDGHQLLRAAQREGTPSEVQEAASLEIVRRIWVQQYYVEGKEVHWRTKKEWGQPPSRKMIASPDEPDARYGSKGGTYWTGYKIHLTESCDSEQPRLITHVETTPATTNDVNVTEKVQDDLAAQGRAPEKHLVDGGYTSLHVLINSKEEGIELIGPMAGNQSWQAKSDEAYDHTKFRIDWQTMQATCPEGKVSVSCRKGRTRAGERNIHFHFDFEDCTNCGARSRCTRATKDGRQLCVFPQEQYEILEEARQRQRTEEFKSIYQARAGVEGTIAQAVSSQGVRRARYRGLARTHLQHLATAAAINLSRAADWLCGHRPETTRVTPFVALAYPA
jgi:transposase